MVASGVITIVVGFASFIGLIALGVWQHDSKLVSKYGEDFYELQNYRWSEFSTDLGVLITEINEQTDFQPGENDHRLPPQSEVVTIIDNEIGRERMREIEDSLRRFDRPEELKDKAQSDYKTAYRLLAIASGIYYMLALVLVYSPVGQFFQLVQIIVGFFGGYVILAAVSKVRKAYSAECKLDGMIGDYLSPTES